MYAWRRWSESLLERMDSLLTQFLSRTAVWCLSGLVFLTACDSDDDLEVGSGQDVTIQWSQTNGPNGGGVYALASAGDNLLAGTAHGVFLSENEGAVWTKVLVGASHSIITVNATAFAATPDGVMVSKDDGNTWDNPSSLGHPIYALLAKNGKIFASTPISGFYYSADE